MYIQNISGFQPSYKSVEQIKRGEPVKEPNIPTGSELIEHKLEKQAWKDKFKYDWKTISAITGAAALVLVAVLNRHAIKGAFDRLSSGKNGISSPSKKKYIKPEIKIMKTPDEKVVHVDESDIVITMPKPKNKSQPKKTPQTIYIDEQGRIINPKQQDAGQRTGFNHGQREEMFGRKPTGCPDSPRDVATETIDRMTDFVIIDDLANGGNEVRSIFNGAKNVFKGAENTGGSIVDDIVAAGATDEIVADTGADILSGVAEHSSGLMDTIGGIFDGASDGLSGLAESIGDIFESAI